MNKHDEDGGVNGSENSEPLAPNEFDDENDQESEGSVDDQVEY